MAAESRFTLFCERSAILLHGHVRKLRGKGACCLRTVCCYEAGYDGFWLHRVLVNHGVERRSVSTSAVKKSVPASSAKWVRMKAGHVVVRLRSGAGGKAWRCKTDRKSVV